MKYISLFSGIGGFEVGINRAFSKRGKCLPECIAFSEIDKFAKQVYSSHFPSHTNLGDITKITKGDIHRLLDQHDGCDLLVGGFPCTNLTSLALLRGNSDGLNGPASGLFWIMLQIIGWIQEWKSNKGHSDLRIIIENNASMKNANKRIILEKLTEIMKTNVYMTELNGALFGIQHRRRIFWTTRPVSLEIIQVSQTWDDVLVPMNEIKYFDPKLLPRRGNYILPSNRTPYIFVENPDGTFRKKILEGQKGHSRWQMSFNSSTALPHGKTIIRGRNHHGVLFDYRFGDEDSFAIRFFENVELERLFWFPDGWTEGISSSRAYQLFGNAVITRVVQHAAEFELADFLSDFSESADLAESEIKK